MVVVLDLSGSMRAILPGDPIAPRKESAPTRSTRFDAEIAAVRGFLAHRKDVPTGLVVFGKEAFKLSPISVDQPTMDGLLARLDWRTIDPTGSALGDGVASALTLLRKRDEFVKRVVLVTDGDPNAGNMSAEAAGSIAAELDCQIDVVQIGDGTEVEIEEGIDLQNVPRYARITFPATPELLRGLANATHGTMSIATTTDELVAALKKLER